MNEVVHYVDHSGLRQRVKQIEHERLYGEDKSAGIPAHRLHRKALLRITLVRAQVLLRHTIQNGKQFDPLNAAERIIRSHQERASFARADINEGELLKINFQVRDHIPEKRRFVGLVGRMKVAQQALAPADGGAGGIDTVIPIIFRVSVTTASLPGCRLPQESPDVSGETPGRRQKSTTCQTFFPTSTYG